MSLGGGFKPEVEPGIYIPLYILYGFCIGMALSVTVPRLGSFSTTNTQLRRALLAGGIIFVVSIPLELLVYPVEYVSALSADLLFAIIYPLGIAIALRSSEKYVTESI